MHSPSGFSAFAIWNAIICFTLRYGDKGVRGIGYSQTCELCYHNYRITIFLSQGAERNYLNRVEYGSIVIRPWEGGGHGPLHLLHHYGRELKLKQGCGVLCPQQSGFRFDGP